MSRSRILWVLAGLSAGSAVLPSPVLAARLFVRGDANADERIDISDGIVIFGFLFLGSPETLPCFDAADANDSSKLDISDGIYILSWLFSGGVEPVHPFPFCGSDLTADPFDCEEFTGCLAPDLTVRIERPIHQELRTSPSVDVSGTVEPSGTTVDVNGVPAQVTGRTFLARQVPLVEGTNILVATARNPRGVSVADAIWVLRDTVAPYVVFESPLDGDRFVIESVPVAGTVNDIIPGATVNADDVSVRVNGQLAQVNNRAFFLSNVPLELGSNTLTAVATDKLGNTRRASITVTREPDLAGIRILPRGGNAQRGAIGSTLPEPVAVHVETIDGRTLVDRPLNFTVSRGDGLLGDPAENQQTLTLFSDASGNAQESFTLGSRTGEGFHRVRVTTPGSLTYAEFCATALPGDTAQISAMMLPRKQGLVNQRLADRLSVMVTDNAGNPVRGVDVAFQITAGGGSFDGESRIPVPTNRDGVAEANWILGPSPGVENNQATATFAGYAGLPLLFLASGVLGGPAEETRVSGVVQTSVGGPLRGVRAVIRGTDREASSGADGKFTITNVPPGGHRLVIEGSAADNPSQGLHYANIEFALGVLTGVDNQLDQVVVLPFVDMENARVVGGSEDVELIMAGVPGFAIKVFNNSVILPDGTRGTARMTSSQVKFDKLPMPPPQGSTPFIVGTLQPPGIRFDPPAQVTYPNVTALAPGDVADIFGFHHDIGQFVNLGPGTVVRDGSLVVSDPGFGLVMSGWHCLIRMPGPLGNCANDCSVALTWQTGGQNTRRSSPIVLCPGQTALVAAQFSPAGGAFDSVAWSGGGGLVTLTAAATDGATARVTVEAGTATGDAVLTTPTYRLMVPDRPDKTCVADISVKVVKPEIEKVGMTVIEASNNYSESTRVRVTLPDDLGGTNVRFLEETGTAYYAGQNGATDLTRDATRVVPVSGGAAELTLKSLSNSDSVSGPADAMIRAELLDSTGGVICRTEPIPVDQWVDEDADGAIDWLEQHANAILACAKGASGELGVVTGTVSGIAQDNAAGRCGVVIGGKSIRVIQISPVCGSPNRHRLNASNELSDSVIHEARHVWQRSELARNDVGQDDDVNAATPSNDDDDDWLAEAVSFTSANRILESQSGTGDNSDDDRANSIATVIEQDAQTFGAAHSSTCP